MNFSSIYTKFFYVFYLFFPCVLLITSYGKFLSSFVYVIIYCVGAGITNLMSIFDGSDPYFFRRKMEKTRSVKEEIDGEMFISHQSRQRFLYK